MYVIWTNSLVNGYSQVKCFFILKQYLSNCGPGPNWSHDRQARTTVFQVTLCFILNTYIKSSVFIHHNFDFQIKETLEIPGNPDEVSPMSVTPPKSSPIISYQRLMRFKQPICLSLLCSQCWDFICYCWSSSLLFCWGIFLPKRIHLTFPLDHLLSLF